MSKTFTIFLGYADDAQGQIDLIKKIKPEIQEYIQDEANKLSSSKVFENVEMLEWREDASQEVGGQKTKIDPMIEKCDIAIFVFKSRIGGVTKDEVELAIKKNKKIICLFPNQNIFTDLTKEGFNDFMSLADIASFKKELTNDWISPISKSITPIDEYDNNTIQKLLSSKVEAVIKNIYVTKNVKQDEVITIEEADTVEIKEKINLHIHLRIPPRDNNFIDRKDDIKDIINSVQQNKECMVYSLKGLGGIGKSAITTEICHIFKSTWDNSNEKEYLKPILRDKKYFEDGILWIKFEKDLSFERHIEIISESINYKLEYDNNLDELKNKIEEVFYDNDILIVLDSAEQNRDNFIKFYNLFVGLKSIIITTREKFDFIDNVKDLNKLDEGDARKLFQKYLSSSLEEKAIKIVDEICLEIDYLPLAVIIMAKMSNDLGLKKVRDDVNAKLTYKREVVDNGQLKSISIEDVFDLSYFPLSDAEKRILSVASIFNYSFSIESLEGILENKNASVHLKTLVNKSLIDSVFDGEGELIFSFHPLMRTFALNYFEKLSDKNDLQKVKETYYLNIVRSSQSILHEHIKEVLAVLKVCDDNTYLRYVETLHIWLSEYGYWKDREVILKSTIKRSSNQYGISYFRLALGDLYSRQRKFNEAKYELHQVLAYYSSGTSDKNYLDVHYRLNSIEYKQGNYKDSYQLNNKFTRESLFYNDKYYANAFIRTNGWILNNYQKNNLTLNSILISFLDQIHAIKDSNALHSFKDITDYLEGIEEFEQADKIIKIIEIYYGDFVDYNSMKLDLISMKIDKKNNTNTYNHELDAINELMLKINQKDLLSYINSIKGRIAFYKKDFVSAKKYFSKLNDIGSVNYWLGQCELKNNVLDKAKKYLIKSKKDDELHQNIFEVASVNIYLALIESKKNLENASKMLSQCKKVFEEFDFTPKEYYEVVEQVDGLSIDTTGITVEKTDFFLEDLPSTLRLEDLKEMVLMKKGMSFYGKGNQEFLTIDRVVDEIEEMFEDKEYYKRYQDNIFLYDFYIDKECVTNQEYINYCQSAEIKVPSYLVGIADELLNEPVSDKKLTVEDAKAYASYYGKELPLPQEWEKAFRGENGSLHFKDSTTQDLLSTYEMFEITDKHSFSGSENRFRNSSDKYKLTDTFSKKEASKKFIFRCVKPIFSIDDLNLKVDV